MITHEQALELARRAVESGPVWDGDRAVYKITYGFRHFTFLGNASAELMAEGILSMCKFVEIENER